MGRRSSYCLSLVDVAARIRKKRTTTQSAPSLELLDLDLLAFAALLRCLLVELEPLEPLRLLVVDLLSRRCGKRWSRRTTHTRSLMHCALHDDDTMMWHTAWHEREDVSQARSSPKGVSMSAMRRLNCYSCSYILWINLDPTISGGSPVVRAHPTFSECSQVWTCIRISTNQHIKFVSVLPAPSSRRTINEFRRVFSS